MAKETIDVLDIIQLIGERPFPMPKSMQAYIEETKVRKKIKIIENQYNNMIGVYSIRVQLIVYV